MAGCFFPLTTVLLAGIYLISSEAARTFRIKNQCSQKIWMGVQGQPLIVNGGFEVNAGSSIDVSVPDGWV
jgi:hypothetical protein